MKRTNHLFNEIVSFENLRTAYLKARKGKTSKAAIQKFSKNINKNLQTLHKRMVQNPPSFSTYHQFTIYDPKERIISVVPFCDRVIHHAIINVLEPIFEKQFIYNTYACRKDKGTHKAALYAQKKAKSCKWYLKLDVRKYFDSINHKVLENQLEKIIKDKKVLQLLFSIIESYGMPEQVGHDNYCHSELVSESHVGLPIGNLTSQFFANLYLSTFDHYVLEVLKPAGYVRYMDDMIIFGNSKEDLLQLFYKINEYCVRELCLSLKTPIFRKTKDGITFLGWTIYKDYIKPSAKTQKRMKRKIKNIVKECADNEQTALERIECVYACRKLM